MRALNTVLRSSLALGAVIFALGCSDGVAPGGTGVLRTRLTDAPFPTDQVKRVDLFVVRVDARTSDVGDDEADQSLESESSSSAGWKTIATPNASFDLLSLRNGNSVLIGQSVLPAGNYEGFRIVIDQSKSSVTLKTGQVLNGGSTPGIKFPSAGQSGIKILLAEPLKIVAGTETELVIDFDVEQSFVMRGNDIDKNGLLFKPVVKSNITNLALTNARVRLANATDSSLTMLLGGNPLIGSSNLAFGTSSACNSVNVTTSVLTITRGASNFLLPGFMPSLTAGHPATFVAYPGMPPGTVLFAQLANDNVPATGQAGFRVFNASPFLTPFDVYVTVPDAPLGTATIANVAAGATSTFVNVPAGSSQIRLTATGDKSKVLLNMGPQQLNADQNTTLIIAPPLLPTTDPRAFLAPSC